MKISTIESFTKGWFIGNFEPAIIKTEDFECAVKTYNAGNREEAHYHKIATEITVIVSGDVQMNGKLCSEGDIIVLEPNDITDFYAISDAVTAVVKIPSVIGDKYSVGEE